MIYKLQSKLIFNKFKNSMIYKLQSKLILNIQYFSTKKFKIQINTHFSAYQPNYTHPTSNPTTSWVHKR